MRFISIFLLLFFVVGCQLASEENLPLTVDSYYEETPTVKTVAIKLLNEDITTDDLEFKQFFRRLKPVLENKGYRFSGFSGTPQVTIEIEFGSGKEGYERHRSRIDNPSSNDPFRTTQEFLASITRNVEFFRKYIFLNAVETKNKKNQYWKITVSELSRAPDFRAAEGKLLYLLSHFIEKESYRVVAGELADAEYYQRYVLGYSPAEASAYLYVPAEMKNQYERELQARVNANISAFKKCGLTEKRQISFMVSQFGTLPSFDVRGAFEVMGSSLPEGVRKCIAEVFEPLLDVPLDIDTTQPMLISIPIK